MSEQAIRRADPLAAYLCFQESGDPPESWAALLVVDRFGLPQEFLYSGPLRATPVQQILYQDRLVGQTRLSLVRALFRGLRCKPAYLAGQREELASFSLTGMEPPVLSLEAGGSLWLRAPADDAERLRAEIEAVVGDTEPLGRARAALAYVVEYERAGG